jgi:hypothetical protein
LEGLESALTTALGDVAGLEEVEEFVGKPTLKA